MLTPPLVGGKPGPQVTPPLVAAPQGATKVADTGVENFNVSSAGGTAIGKFESAVYQESKANGSTLDFYYQITLNSSSTDSFTKFSASGFDGFMANVGYTATAFGPFLAPVPGGGAAVFPDSANFATKTTIDFDFGFVAGDPLLAPGQTSVILVISTNATQWKPATSSPHDGFGPLVKSFAPTLGVPEPATMALLGAGLMALAGIRRYRR
jgi:hypothetical protein